MMSADCSARRARSVSSSGSPGPAPTSVTAPASRPCSFVLPKSASKSRCVGSCAGWLTAKAVNSCQNRRRAAGESADACTALRQRRAASAQREKPPGIIASSLARIACAKTGAAPAVEMPITNGERLTMAPNEKSQCAGRSITLTGTPAARAAPAKRAAFVSFSKPPTATAAPVKSSVRHARCRNVREVPGASNASAQSSWQGRSAKTSTFAPAADKSSAFHATGAPLPAMIARLPASSKKMGSRASGCMRGERGGCGGG